MWMWKKLNSVSDWSRSIIHPSDLWHNTSLDVNPNITFSFWFTGYITCHLLCTWIFGDSSSLKAYYFQELSDTGIQKWNSKYKFKKSYWKWNIFALYIFRKSVKACPMHYFRNFLAINKEACNNTLIAREMHKHQGIKNMKW